MTQISIVVPAHNEEGNLYNLFTRLIPALEQNKETRDFEVVIVNDNSTDKTAVIIDDFASKDPRIKPVHRTSTPGFGNAIKTGLKKASGNIMIPVMADLSDDPNDIQKLVWKIEEGYDIAYGSRFCKGGSTNSYPKKKMLANRTFNNTVRLLFGIRHKDVTNAFKAYRKEVLDAIGIDNLEATGFDLTVEIPLKAHILGFSSAEVPVSWHDRKMGEAKLKLSQNGHRYGSRLIKMFVLGNIIGLGDLLGTIVKGSPLRIIFAVLLGLLLLGGIFSVAGISEVFDILSDISPGYVALACLMITTTFVVRTWRWSVLLRESGHRVHRDTAFKCIMFGWLLNYLLPARIGDVARGMALKTTEGTPLSISLSSIIIERAMDMFTLGMMLMTTLLFFSKDTHLFSIAIGALAIAFILIAGLLFVSKYDHIIANRLGTRFESLLKGINELNEGLRNIYSNPQAIILCLILSLPIWIFEIASIYFSAKAINFSLSPGISTLAGITAFIAQAIPTTPGGIGVHEGSIAGVLNLFNINLTIGTSIALVDHFARGLVTYVLGMISAVHIGFESRGYFTRTKNDTRNGD
ncbi:flippase-like domain-containing protein [Methanolobus sp. WCC4]|uniref:flippase-like domain-containing protein n=1 Tax=Methanolobus sp. WCC4 TaxID=3125784 RepID=UPI0030FA699E